MNCSRIPPYVRVQRKREPEIGLRWSVGAEDLSRHRWGPSVTYGQRYSAHSTLTQEIMGQLADMQNNDIGKKTPAAHCPGRRVRHQIAVSCTQLCTRYHLKLLTCRRNCNIMWHEKRCMSHDWPQGSSHASPQQVSFNA